MSEKVGRITVLRKVEISEVEYQWMLDREKELVHAVADQSKAISDLEAELGEAKEQWIQEREALISLKAENITLGEKLAEARKDGDRFRFQFDPANLEAIMRIEDEALAGPRPDGVSPIDWWREKIDAAMKEGA